MSARLGLTQRGKKSLSVRNKVVLRHRADKVIVRSRSIAVHFLDIYRVLLAKAGDISDFPESAAVSSVSRPSDTKPQASDTGGRKTFAKARHRLGFWSTKLASRSH